MTIQPTGLGRRNWKRISVLLVCSAIALLIGANAHLVFVALRSQPECVSHVKQAGEAGTYRAARSAC